MKPTKQTEYNSRRDAEKLGGKPHTGVTIASLGIGTAGGQTISPETWGAAQEEIARLSARVRELEAGQEVLRAASHRLLEEREDYCEKFNWEAEQNEPLKARVRELEAWAESLKDGRTAHVLILRGDIAVTREQVLHILGDDGGKSDMLPEPLYLPQRGAEGDLDGECIGGDGEGG